MVQQRRGQLVKDTLKEGQPSLLVTVAVLDFILKEGLSGLGWNLTWLSDHCTEGQEWQQGGHRSSLCERWRLGKAGHCRAAAGPGSWPDSGWRKRAVQGRPLVLTRATVRRSREATVKRQSTGLQQALHVHDCSSPSKSNF